MHIYPCVQCENKKSKFLLGARNFLCRPLTASKRVPNDQNDVMTTVRPSVRNQRVTAFFGHTRLLIKPVINHSYHK